MTSEMRTSWELGIQYDLMGWYSSTWDRKIMGTILLRTGSDGPLVDDKHDDWPVLNQEDPEAIRLSKAFVSPDPLTWLEHMSCPDGKSWNKLERPQEVIPVAIIIYYNLLSNQNLNNDLAQGFVFNGFKYHPISYYHPQKAVLYGVGFLMGFAHDSYVLLVATLLGCRWKSPHSLQVWNGNPLPQRSRSEQINGNEKMALSGFLCNNSSSCSQKKNAKTWEYTSFSDTPI